MTFNGMFLKIKNFLELFLWKFVLMCDTINANANERKNNMKKLILLLLTLSLMLTACGKNETENDIAAPSKSPETITAPGEECKNESDKKEEVKEENKKEEIKEDKKEENKKEETSAPSSPAQTASPTSPPQTPAPAPSAEEVINKILQGVDTPRYEITPITSENFSYMMFTDYVEGAVGFSADALISSTAHSVCLVSLPAGSDVNAFANRVRKNADPRKWICVEAEKVEVATKGNMVLLVMSDSITTDKIVNNFIK